MAEPFKRPEPKDERWKLLDYMRPNESDDATEREVIGVANEFLSWCSQPFHEKFIGWLTRKSHQPVAVHSDHMAMVAQAARCDVYREILTHLEQERRRAMTATGSL